MGHSKHNLTLCVMIEYSICAWSHAKRSFVNGASFSTAGVIVLLQSPNSMYSDSLTGIHLSLCLKRNLHSIFCHYCHLQFRAWQIKEPNNRVVWTFAGNPCRAVFHPGSQAEPASFCTFDLKSSHCLHCVFQQEPQQLYQEFSFLP